MKNKYWSLAALMLMAAPMMTSCNEEALEEKTPEVVTPEVGTHEETITIAFPDQDQTRLGIDEDNKLTGWEIGDQVTLVDTNYLDDDDPSDGMPYVDLEKNEYIFKCIDDKNGVFSGTLPDGVNVRDCELAFYNATDIETGTNYDELITYLNFSPKNRASKDMKDVVVMVAKNNKGNFEMEIFGSILEVTNNTDDDITAYVKYSWEGSYDCYDRAIIRFDATQNCFEDFLTDLSAYKNHPITLSCDAPTYVYIPVYNMGEGSTDFTVGLSAVNDKPTVCSVIPARRNPGNARLFKKTTTITTGTAMRKGGILENWVQLWDGGPKFATYNVGVKDGKAESYGGYYAWGGSQDKIDDHKAGTGDLTGDYDTATKLWGDAWRMPTSAEFEAIKTNCDIAWDYINYTGINITGRGNYSGNSIFLPAAREYKNDEVTNGQYGEYWTSTSSGEEKALSIYIDWMDLLPPPAGSGQPYSVSTSYRNVGRSVRAVVAE